MLKNTEKSIQLKIDGTAIRKGLSDVSNEAESLVKNMQSGAGKLNDILTFKNYMLDILTTADKRIYSRIRKDMLSKIEDMTPASASDQKLVEMVKESM